MHCFGFAAQEARRLYGVSSVNVRAPDNLDLEDDSKIIFVESTCSKERHSFHYCAEVYVPACVRVSIRPDLSGP